MRVEKKKELRYLFNAILEMNEIRYYKIPQAHKNKITNEICAMWREIFSALDMSFEIKWAEDPTEETKQEETKQE